MDTSLEHLGTVLSVWAHPDDETYLAGGVMSAAREAGQRVVCVTASAGERGTSDPDAWPPGRLGAVRRWEAAAAMAVLGVDEHHVLGLPDGDLAEHDAQGIAHVVRLFDEVRPDTVLTFGPDGATFHPDHIAVHRWVTEAWRQRGGAAQLLYAAATVDHLDRFAGLYEDWGVYMSDERPIGVREEDLAINLVLDGPSLDRKLTALRAMATQTADALRLMGEDLYRAQAAQESFVRAAPAGWSRRPARVTSTGAARPGS